jgi:GTP-binding protein YchF
MALEIGIIGLPNVGKSTLFNALTGSNILAANYPFATIEPNTGIVPVPDKRLNQLSQLYHGAPIKPATVTFVDIAGLVAGASQGEGLGNQFLATIRTTDAILHIVRAFEDSNILHVDEQHTPAKDIDVINTELLLADLQTIQKRLPKFQKEARTNSKLKSQLDTMEWAQGTLDNGIPLFSLMTALPEDDWNWLRQELQLLTMKQIIYLFNVDEKGLTDADKQAALRQLVEPARSLFVSAQLESELTSLDAADAEELLTSYGQSESGLIQVIHAAYETLGLQSFLTAGDQEVRAWTIHQGATAPQAAGVIHGDFERGFIAAEVVPYQDLIANGSLTAAKSAGKVRTEGKTYIMQADDIVEFRFNV